MVAAGELLEWAEFAGNKYGTPREPVERRLEQGLPTLLEIDLAGARQVREAMKDDALLVFLKPPSWAELVRRLTRRGTGSRTSSSAVSPWRGRTRRGGRVRRHAGEHIRRGRLPGSW